MARMNLKILNSVDPGKCSQGVEQIPNGSGGVDGPVFGKIKGFNGGMFLNLNRITFTLLKSRKFGKDV